MFSRIAVSKVRKSQMYFTIYSKHSSRSRANSCRASSRAFT